MIQTASTLVSANLTAWAVYAAVGLILLAALWILVRRGIRLIRSFRAGSEDTSCTSCDTPSLSACAGCPMADRCASARRDASTEEESP